MSPDTKPVIQQQAQQEVLMNKLAQLVTAIRGMAPLVIATSTAMQTPAAANTTQTAANRDRPQGAEAEPRAGRSEELRPPDRPQLATVQSQVSAAEQPSPPIPVAERKDFATMQSENDLQASAKLDKMNRRILELETMLQAATASIETMSDRASTAGKSRKSDKDRNDEMLKHVGIPTTLETTVLGQGSSSSAAGGQPAQQPVQPEPPSERADRVEGERR